MDYYEIATILLNVLTISGMIYLTFVKSYFNEKGKSLALKEDLDEITTTVESIKNKFAQNQEEVKNELNRVLNNKLSYRNEERKAIIEFNAVISEWLFKLLNVKYNSIGWVELESLSSSRLEIDEFYTSAGIARAKLELLVESKQLVSMAYKLYGKVMEFSHWCDGYFMQFEYSLQDKKRISTSSAELLKNVNENREILKLIIEEDKDLQLKYSELIKEYRQSRNDKYFLVRDVNNEFIQLVQGYLKE